MNRLDLIASYTKGSKVVCDIGCDHAYALISALKHYGVEKGIAADINEGPLNNAIKSIMSNNLEDQVKAILSNGFDSILDDFDTAIISGMGGKLICEILTKGLDKVKGKKLILEANSDMPDVRRWLFNNGFIIIAEESLYDQNKYYEIVVAEAGTKEYDDIDILYGPILRNTKNEAYVKHYSEIAQMLNEVVPKIQDYKIQRDKLNILYEIEYMLDFGNVKKYYLNDGINFYRTYYIDDEPRPTIVVAPGGGYTYSSPREAEPVVREFRKRGYNVVVVNYRETLDAYPYPGNLYVETLNNISNDKQVKNIICLGFSAGGHLVLETLLHKEKYGLKAHVDLLMLAYPVITSDPKYAHMGSFKALLLENEFNEELREYVSLEKEVTKENAIDLFLWGTYTDASVVVQNSLKLIDAYINAGGSAEYHMFPEGRHGLSVSYEKPYVARWVDMAHEWIKSKLN